MIAICHLILASLEKIEEICSRTTDYRSLLFKFPITCSFSQRFKI